MGRQLFIVKGFETKHEDATKNLSCRIDKGQGEESVIWFRVRNLPPESRINSADAFFAPCLLYALKHDADIRFDVPVSEDLADASADIAFILGTQLGLNQRPLIELSRPVRSERQSEGAVIGFSGGVDSWFSLKRHLLQCRLPSKRLTHLVFNDVGANTGTHVRQARTRAQHVADEYGLGLILVESNMNAFLKMGFELTHTARNASVAHLLTSVAETFHYASSETFVDAGIFPNKSASYADSIILPLLSSDAIQLRSSGSSVTRGEKTRQILDIDRIGESLDVCVRSDWAARKLNCGRCWKCLRTALTLEAFDALQQFEPVFDLDAYRKFRSIFVSHAAVSRKAIEREPFDLARKAGLVGPRLFYVPAGVARRTARGSRLMSKIGRRLRRP